MPFVCFARISSSVRNPCSPKKNVYYSKRIILNLFHTSKKNINNNNNNNNNNSLRPYVFLLKINDYSSSKNYNQNDNNNRTRRNFSTSAISREFDFAGRKVRLDNIAKRSKSKNNRPEVPMPSTFFSNNSNNDNNFDEFSWLENKKDPNVLQYLQSENLYSTEVLQSTIDIQKQLFSEYESRLGNGKEISIPEKIGNFYYYSKRVEGLNYPLYYRCEILSDNTEEEKVGKNERIVLDQNELQENYHFRYVELGNMKVSHDHKYVAYTLNTSGDDIWTLYIRNIESGIDYTCSEWKECIKGFEWGSLNSPYLMYTTKIDHMYRPCEVIRYQLHEDAFEKNRNNNIKTLDQLKPFVHYKRRRRFSKANNIIDNNNHENKIYFSSEQLHKEEDDAFFVDVNRTKDHKFVAININSKKTSEIHVIEAFKYDSKPQLLRKRMEGIQYFADHGNDYFYIVSNLGTKDCNGNYELYQYKSEKYLDVNQSKAETNDNNSWELVKGGNSDTQIVDIDLFKQFCVIYQKNQGVDQINVVKRNSVKETETDFCVPLPTGFSCSTIHPGLNQEYTSNYLRFSITSPITPNIEYSYDMQNNILNELEREIIPGKSPFKIDDYKCYRIAVPGEYGSYHHPDVPLTLIHNSNISMNGQNPLLLIGYGAYGVNLEAEYRVEHLSLLERGWIIAYAHVRGGGELGRQWYINGKEDRKENSFHDFIHCAEYLVKNGFTNPKLLCAFGSSAGGLLLGVAANRRPDLFAAMILNVPFLDIASTMKDPTLPLTVHEYDEWGDPANVEIANYMANYSPYHNIAKNEGHNYPALFIRSALNDERVKYWQSAKFVAKLRQYYGQEATKNIVMRISGNSGHFGGGGVYDIFGESAEEHAFLLDQLGLDK